MIHMCPMPTNCSGSVCCHLESKYLTFEMFSCGAMSMSCGVVNKVPVMYLDVDFDCFVHFVILM